MASGGVYFSVFWGVRLQKVQLTVERVTKKADIRHLQGSQVGCQGRMLEPVEANLTCSGIRKFKLAVHHLARQSSQLFSCPDQFRSSEDRNRTTFSANLIQWYTYQDFEREVGGYFTVGHGTFRTPICGKFVESV